MAIQDTRDVKREFVLPTKPLTITDAINRRALATGDWRNAQRSSDADYNGHNVEVRWNEYRGYWVASYTWSGPHIIARGDLSYCLREASSFYESQGRGASVKVLARNADDATACVAAGYIPAESEDLAWRDWRFEEINFALEMERRGFGAYTHNLLTATSRDDFVARNSAAFCCAPISAYVAHA